MEMRYELELLKEKDGPSDKQTKNGFNVNSEKFVSPVY